MMLSKYVSLKEATKSQIAIANGIPNYPSEEELRNMRYVAQVIFDPVRTFIGGPLYVSSFYRSRALNRLVSGSSRSSQHMTGEAVDMDCDVFKIGTNAGIFFFIKNQLLFDQLIGEYPTQDGNFAWIHASVRRDGRNRMEVLIKLIDRYIPFSEWKPGMV